LRQLAHERGAGLLVVEHKTDLLASIAERCLVLAGGRVVAAGAAAEILADPRLEEWGVEAPAAVRIRRAAQAAGLAEPMLSALTAVP
jgi:ABC-type glutathione transport system ATPase component